MKKLFLNIYFYISFLIFITFSGCLDIPSELILPEWDVDLNVPLVNKSYELEEIIKSDEQEYISLNPSDDSLYYIQSQTERLSSDIKEFVKINTQASIQNEIIKVEDADKTVYLPFPEQALLEEAEFTEGYLIFVARNTSNDNIGLQITIPGITNPSGQVLSPVFNLSPYQTDSIRYNLSGYRYKEPANQLFLFKGQIWIKARTTTATNPADSVLFSAYSSNMNLKYAKGYIPKRSLGVQKDTFEIKVGSAKDFEGKVHLKEAKLNLKAKYFSPQSNPFEIAMDSIQLIAKKKDGSQKLLLVNNSPLFKINFYGGTFDTVFTEANTNITEFISFLPDEVIIQGVFVINPRDDKNTHIVTNQDSIIFETDFSSRSIFAISKSTIKDTFKIELTTEERDRIKDALDAKVTVELQNAIPMTAWVKADLYDSLYNFLFTVTKNSNNTDSVNVSGAFVGADGHVSSSNFSTTKIELSSSQIQLLSRAHHAIYSVTVETSNQNNQQPPPIIYLKGSDWMKVRAYGGVKYHLKPEDEK